MNFVQLLLLFAASFFIAESFTPVQWTWINELEQAAPLLNDKHLNFVEVSLDCADQLLYLVYAKTCCNQCQGLYACDLISLFAGLANLTNPAASYWQPDFLPPLLFAICPLVSTTTQCQGTRRSFNINDDDYNELDVPRVADVREKARLSGRATTSAPTPTTTTAPGPSYLTCNASPAPGLCCNLGANFPACLACCALIASGQGYTCASCGGVPYAACFTTTVTSFSTCANVCNSTYNTAPPGSRR